MIVHWKKAAFDFYVGRNGEHHDVPAEKDAKLENPFPVERYGRGVCIEMFEEYARSRMTWDRDFRNRIHGCYKKTLGCWCAPRACHARVIHKLAAELHDDEETVQLIARVYEGK